MYRKRSQRRTRRSRPQQRRKRAFKKAVKLAIGSSRRPAMHLHTIHDIYTINPSSTDTSLVFSINPTTTQRWATYNSLYDSYRVISATFDFIPNSNVSQTWMEGSPAVANQWSQGITFLKYDKDDGTPAAGFNQCVIENYADRPSMRRFRYTVKPPKFTMSDDAGDSIFGRHSCQDNTKIDGWLKTYISCNPDIPALNLDQAVNGYTVIIKYLVCFYDYVTPKTTEPAQAKEVKFLAH